MHGRIPPRVPSPRPQAPSEPLPTEPGPQQPASSYRPDQGVRGKVVYIQRDQKHPDGPPMPMMPDRPIPVLRFRIRTAEGEEYQARYQGELIGDIAEQDVVRVKGANYGGVIEASEIFNEKVNAVITAGRGPCFIATAAYGSPVAAEVEVLRGFRDAKMCKWRIGPLMLRWYGRLSPPLAHALARRPGARWVIREALVHPAALIVRAFARGH